MLVIRGGMPRASIGHRSHVTRRCRVRRLLGSQAALPFKEPVAAGRRRWLMNGWTHPMLDLSQGTVVYPATQWMAGFDGRSEVIRVLCVASWRLAPRQPRSGLPIHRLLGTAAELRFHTVDHALVPGGLVGCAPPLRLRMSSVVLGLDVHLHEGGMGAEVMPLDLGLGLVRIGFGSVRRAMAFHRDLVVRAVTLLTLIQWCRAVPWPSTSGRSGARSPSLSRRSWYLARSWLAICGLLCPLLFRRVVRSADAEAG